MPQNIHKRIYIVGPSGSGKTTLGKFICAKLGLPHFELDQIAYPDQKEQILKKRLAAVSRLAQKAKWVTEGIYVSWTKKLIEQADLIIWLDMPYYKTLFRVIKRFIAHKLRGDEKFGFKNTLKFIFHLKKYYYNKEGDLQKQTTRAQTKKVLEPFKGKVIQIKEIKNLDWFLTTISYTRYPIPS